MAIDPSTARYRLGFDIGGTFTDFVLLDATTGGISLHKCLTTPEDPADGALDGIYDLFLRFPDPLVPRHRRIEIAERLAYDGRVLEPLDEAAVLAEGTRLVADGCSAIAVSFLHS